MVRRDLHPPEKILKRLFRFKNSLDLHRDSGRKRGKAHGGAGMIAVAVLAEDFMQEIRGAIDDKMLFDKIRRAVDTSQQFDHPDRVERSGHPAEALQEFDRHLVGRGLRPALRRALR